jgi:hypothetical protein
MVNPPDPVLALLARVRARALRWLSEQEGR